MTDRETATDRPTDRLTDRETGARAFKERHRRGKRRSRGGKVFRERERTVFTESGGEEGPVQFH